VCGNSQAGRQFGCGGPAGIADTAVRFTTPAWSLQTTANYMAPNGGLSATSCSSVRACTAVGSYINRTGSQATLAERWDGTSWTIQTTPDPKGATGSSLSGVSCTSATACTAVGKYQTGNGMWWTLAERWDGRTWRIQATPNPGSGGALSGVSCTSATACTAVGYFNGDVALAERWDGTSWTIQITPKPSGASLDAVSCTSATACTAVGFNGQPLAERWDGRTWRIQTTPSSDNGDYLSGVSCTSAAACTAVGSDASSAVILAERWDGRRWTIQTTDDSFGVGSLSAVSCTSATACTAIGRITFCGLRCTYNGPLVESWDGTTWTEGTAPGGVLSGLSCPSASACTAVGYANGETLAERSWTIQTTPNRSGAVIADAFGGVSCTSATACIAVGSSAYGRLAERWDGTTWRLQTTPSGGGLLAGVSCTSATACTAVGYSYNSEAYLTLAEHWDGTSWTIQTIPSPDNGSSLSGVSCTSATACTAVGWSDDGQLTLAERWDGTSWTIQATPNPPVVDRLLNAVSCASATACSAVGHYVNAGPGCPPGGCQRTLAERWDGTSWTIQTTPNPTTFGDLNGVSCTSATACTAVGSASGDAGRPPTTSLAERWDGTSWTIQTTPNPVGATSVSLSGVSCASATACTAVGSYENGHGSPVPLAERWDGTSWTIQTTPTPSSGGGLNGVSCTSATACTAVGRTGSPLTLAERYSG
jgi:hypothetical protein